MSKQNNEAYSAITITTSDGNQVAFLLDFPFKKQKAKVTIEIDVDMPNRCRLVSRTDGYHWLAFWLSQDVNSTTLAYLSYQKQVEIVQFLFSMFNIKYEQEDKESAYLTSKNPIDIDFIIIVASIIRPRFALRERHFIDGDTQD